MSAELQAPPHERSAFRAPSSAPIWHILLDQQGRTGAHNMALDWSLLAAADRTGAAFLRLYRWTPPCLSFGRNEPALALYDRTAIARLGLDVVRRPTGGRAVWHEYELTYAVAAPVAAFGTLRAAHRAIHARLAAALARLGAAATLAPQGPPVVLDAGPCFARPAGGEVLVGGRKVVGSALVRRGAVFLQHGSILLDGSQDVVHAVSCEPRTAAGAGATTLSAALRRPLSFEEVAAVILAEWDERAEWHERSVQSIPHSAIRIPHCPSPFRIPHSLTARFADPAWIWRR